MSVCEVPARRPDHIKLGSPAMSDSTSANAPKPSSSVKLVLLGEAAVGKVRRPGIDFPSYPVSIRFRHTQVTRRV